MRGITLLMRFRNRGIGFLPRAHGIMEHFRFNYHCNRRPRKHRIGLQDQAFYRSPMNITLGEPDVPS
jgi:hypothetical protein